MRLLQSAGVTARAKVSKVVKFLCSHGAYDGNANSIWKLQQVHKAEFTVKEVDFQGKTYCIAYVKDMHALIEKKLQSLIDSGKLYILPFQMNRDVT